LNVVILACAAAALLRWKLNATWVVIGAGIVGWASAAFAS
jgi:chromate transport protein ChrA